MTCCCGADACPRNRPPKGGGSLEAGEHSNMRTLFPENDVRRLALARVNSSETLAKPLRRPGEAVRQDPAGGLSLY